MKFTEDFDMYNFENGIFHGFDNAYVEFSETITINEFDTGTGAL